MSSNAQYDEDISLLAVASKIDESEPIDWDNEESGRADENERAVLAELRVLAALARVYRDPDAEPEPAAVKTLTIGLDSPPQPDDYPPASWGPLTILSQIGRGGFAKVYRARDAFDRAVAVKLFPVTTGNSDALEHRVIREGSLLARVSHPHVVIVHGVDQSAGFAGLWMEYINGRTMEEELRARGPLGADEATLIAIDLCGALAAVHGRGIVHRDIKAQNVMRQEGGRTVLMDFGAGTELTTGLHRSLDMAGTPLYLAPELFDGSPATRASDIYSLGVLLYRLVTRAYPVDGADRSQIEQAHKAGRVTRLRDARPDLPPRFVSAVERALSADPAARPQTAGEFETALTATAAGPGTTERSWPKIVATAAAALFAIALPIWLIFLSGTEPPARTNNTATVAPPPNPAPPAAAPLDSYTVKASLIRDSNGVESNLASTTPLAASDHLALRVQASREVYLYLMNADDAGETYRLFPLSGHSPTNPLEPTTHRLPGRDMNWVVTSSGGREHFVVIVTPTLDPVLEARVREIPEASENRGVRRARLSDDSIGVLRGVGGLSKRVNTTAGVKSLPWFDGAEELTGAVETTSGAWMRRLTVPGSSR